MAQRQFRSDDTDSWIDKYGSGADGAVTFNTATDSTPNTTLTGTASGTSATAGSGTGFSAGDIVLIHQSQGTGAGAWELNKISSVGGGTNWTMAYNLMNTYGTGAQVYLLKEYTTVEVNSGQTITGLSWDGSKGGIYALLANTSITVTGTINQKGGQGTLGSGSSPVAGASLGGFRGGDLVTNSSKQGESSTGVGGTSTSANGQGGGGATGTNSSNGAGGGGGGHATSGGNGRQDGSGVKGTGGGTAGNAGLTTMVFGGGSGAGNSGSTNNNTSGSSGGGAVILIAPTITVTGAISVKGGDYLGSPFYEGGGGAGGSVLLKGQVLVLGTTLITAAGGAGYLGGNYGGDGRIHADYLTSISGTTTPSIDSRQDSSLTLPEVAGGFYYATQ